MGSSASPGKGGWKRRDRAAFRQQRFLFSDFCEMVDFMIRIDNFLPNPRAYPARWVPEIKDMVVLHSRREAYKGMVRWWDKIMV